MRRPWRRGDDLTWAGAVAALGGRVLAVEAAAPACQAGYGHSGSGPDLQVQVQVRVLPAH